MVKYGIIGSFVSFHHKQISGKLQKNIILTTSFFKQFCLPKLPVPESTDTPIERLIEDIT